MRERPEVIRNIERLVLFDGVCNLCNRNMLFLIHHDVNCRLKFCSVQSPAGQEILAWLGLPVDTHESILLLDGETLYEKSDAVLHIASYLSWRLRWLYVGKVLPRVMRDTLYLWVARNRYKLMGRNSVCAMPSPEISSRFISTTD